MIILDILVTGRWTFYLKLRFINVATQKWIPYCSLIPKNTFEVIMYHSSPRGYVHQLPAGRRQSELKSWPWAQRVLRCNMRQYAGYPCRSPDQPSPAAKQRCFWKAVSSHLPSPWLFDSLMVLYLEIDKPIYRISRYEIVSIHYRIHLFEKT